jgi:hypothetical protein
VQRQGAGATSNVNWSDCSSPAGLAKEIKMEWTIFLVVAWFAFYRHKRDKVEDKQFLILSKLLSGDQDLARDIRDDSDCLTNPADWKPPKI